MTPHKEAPASKDGWAREKAKEAFTKIAEGCPRCFRDVELCIEHLDDQKTIEAALLEANDRGALRTLAACTETIRETSEQNGKMLAEKWADEALLREIGTAFATCLRYADPRAFNISTGKFFKEEWDEIVRKVEARLTPKGTGEKEK